MAMRVQLISVLLCWLLPVTVWAAISPSQNTNSAVPLSSSSASVSPSVVEEPEADDNELPPTEPVKKISTAKGKKTPSNKPSADKKSETGDDVQLYKAIVRVLNKVTAHVQTIEAPIGSVVRSGTIEIIAHRCWKSPPDEMPENAALLEISEVKQGESPSRIFQGWMFSSTPGISALENAFYDVSIVGCEEQQ